MSEKDSIHSGVPWYDDCSVHATTAAGVHETPDAISIRYDDDLMMIGRRVTLIQERHREQFIKSEKGETKSQKLNDDDGDDDH